MIFLAFSTGCPSISALVEKVWRQSSMSHVQILAALQISENPAQAR